MGVKKGHTNNPNGRPKGTANKVHTDIRNFVLKLFERNTRQIQEDLEMADGATRLRFFCAVMPYVCPKLQAVEVKDINDYVKDYRDANEERFKRMTDDELAAEIERLENKIKQSEVEE